MASTQSVAQWHARQPAWYFRHGAPLDEIKAEFIKGTRGNEISISGIPRFGNKIAFTANCVVLDTPSRYEDNLKNQPTVQLAGDELLAFVKSLEDLLQGCVKDAEQRESAKSNIFGETFVRAKVSDFLRVWEGGKRTDEGFPKPGSEVLVMGTAKPYVMAGRWGLTVTIFQIQTV